MGELQIYTTSLYKYEYTPNIKTCANTLDAGCVSFGLVNRFQNK